MVDRNDEGGYRIADPAHHLTDPSRFGIVGFFFDVEGSAHCIDEYKSKPNPELCLEMFRDGSQIANKGLQTVRPIEVWDLLDPRDRNVPFNSEFFHRCRNAGA